MHNELFNQKQNKSLRKKLRSEPTPAEQLLWRHLKGNQLGVKFRRQHGIGKHIVDFYCPKERLVVEVDGDSHFDPEAQSKDNVRTQVLLQNNIRVIRVTNKEVYESIEDVLELIKQQLNTANPT